MDVGGRDIQGCEQGEGFGDRFGHVGLPVVIGQGIVGFPLAVEENVFAEHGARELDAGQEIFGNGVGLLGGMDEKAVIGLTAGDGPTGDGCGG